MSLFSDFSAEGTFQQGIFTSLAGTNVYTLTEDSSSRAYQIDGKDVLRADLDGNKNVIQLDSAGFSVAMTYDSTNRLSQVEWPDGAYAFSYSGIEKDIRDTFPNSLVGPMYQIDIDDTEIMSNNWEIYNNRLQVSQWDGVYVDSKTCTFQFLPPSWPECQWMEAFYRSGLAEYLEVMESRGNAYISPTLFKQGLSDVPPEYNRSSGGPIGTLCYVCYYSYVQGEFGYGHWILLGCDYEECPHNPQPIVPPGGGGGGEEPLCTVRINAPKPQYLKLEGPSVTGSFSATATDDGPFKWTCKDLVSGTIIFQSQGPSKFVEIPFNSHGKYQVRFSRIENNVAICNDFVTVIVFRAVIEDFHYFRPTPGDPNHPDQVSIAIVTNGDKIYYDFTPIILPSTGVSGLTFKEIRVSLLDGDNVLNSSIAANLGSKYPRIRMISGNNISALIVNGLQDHQTYLVRIDVILKQDTQFYQFIGLKFQEIRTDFLAVNVGRKIAAEDDISDDAMSQVQLTMLNRWNFPQIPNSHDYDRDTKLRHNNLTIYDLAVDSGIFTCPFKPLTLTYQFARELGADLLERPTSAQGYGPIFFYSSSWGTLHPSDYFVRFCADSVAVGLLMNYVTHGNRYFMPPTNPNTWTTIFLKNAYDENPNDSLAW